MGNFWGFGFGVGGVLENFLVHGTPLWGTATSASGHMIVVNFRTFFAVNVSIFLERYRKSRKIFGGGRGLPPKNPKEGRGYLKYFWGGEGCKITRR